MNKLYPLVSIVSVNYRQEAVTCDMLDSLRQISYPNYEIILVDNGAQVDRAALFRRHHPGVRVLISRDNSGFAGGTNLGIRHSRGEYVLLLNNDTIVPRGFLEPLVATLEANPGGGAASPKIYYHDAPGVIQYAGASGIDRVTGRGRKEGHLLADDGSYSRVGPTALCHGACMLVRRRVFEEIGLLSELYFMYYEEHDFCERARRRGWQCYYVGTAHIRHRQSMTMGKASPLKTYYLFRNRWLYMRRVNRGASYYLFLLYFLFLGAPRHLLRHLTRREFDHAGSIVRGLIWNIAHPNIHRHETSY
jgi:GT2 family glycosyltransferase